MLSLFKQTLVRRGLLKKVQKSDIHNDTKIFLENWNLSNIKVALTYGFGLKKGISQTTKNGLEGYDQGLVTSTRSVIGNKHNEGNHT